MKAGIRVIYAGYKSGIGNIAPLDSLDIGDEGVITEVFEGGMFPYRVQWDKGLNTLNLKNELDLEEKYKTKIAEVL